MSEGRLPRLPVGIFFRKYPGDSTPKFRYVLCRRHPDDRPIHRKVDVNDDVAKRHDVSPFDLRMARPKAPVFLFSVSIHYGEPYPPCGG